MNPIHDNTGKLIAVEMNQTRYSSTALARMAAECERYRLALERIAAQEVYDVFAFAGAIAGVQSLHEALEADTAATLDLVPPAVAESLLRVDARRELVKAALKWEEADLFNGEERLAEERFWEAVAAFRDAGGDEEG